MDHFFASVASLMSRNVRSAVYNSITDLAQFLGMYKHGNDFTGPFERSLPVLPQPIVLTVVRITLSIASKQVLLEKRRRRRRLTRESTYNTHLNRIYLLQKGAIRAFTN